MPERILIYCDESVERGRYYSQFYGGALVRASDRQEVEQRLQDVKNRNNLNGEMKWSKITENYAEKYENFLSSFFNIIEEGKIKVRIMFRQNINVPPEYDDERVDNEYFLLYYQFIKHAFGLRYWPGNNSPGEMLIASILLDDPPQSPEKFDMFRNYMSSLSDFPVFTSSGVIVPNQEIIGVNSKKHNIMQGLDIVLGGVQSRLNEVHTRPVPPAKRRSKRARAKERVYRVIKDRIWKIYPRFNVGASTATPNGYADRWSHSYRHWNFVPNRSSVDRTRGKRR
ncbi:MAG: hypothetical protein CMF74_06510 [Maricaulis sp.]|nr:hypothetical protein [Maricaulis sp.]HAQ34481.1 hypothetical protein [Alphaproteobacteria bacterium]